MKSIMFNAVRVVVMLAGLSGTCAVHAMDVSFATKVGYDFGGDTLITAHFTDGSTSDIDANDGLFLGAGVSILNDDRNLEAELTANWKYQSIEATNGSITWTRWPIDALFFYRAGSIRAGGGFTYHMSPKLRSSGAAPGTDVDIDSASGGIVQVEYRFGDWGSLGGRYTVLKYDVEGNSKKSNGLGIVLSGRF